MGRQETYLWLQHSLCIVSAVQTNAFIHTIVCRKIVAHLVTVATTFILCPTVSAALCLRRLLNHRNHSLFINYINNRSIQLNIRNIITNNQ